MRLFASLLLLIIPFSLSFPQEKHPSCQVLMKEISALYKGDCMDGLAYGKGIATGEEYYKGTFLNGLPDGKGVYRYKNGSVYSGQWKSGLKDGKGIYTSRIDGKKLVVSGFWKDGNYIGPVLPDEGYVVTNRSNIENYSIIKVSDNKNQVKISFERAMDKYIPGDLTYEISSGYVNRLGQSIVFNYTSCPLYCTLHFTIITSGGIKDCNLGFTILQPGDYEVFISNN